MLAFSSFDVNNFTRDMNKNNQVYWYFFVVCIIVAIIVKKKYTTRFIFVDYMCIHLNV